MRWQINALDLRKEGLLIMLYVFVQYVLEEITLTSTAQKYLKPKDYWSLN